MKNALTVDLEDYFQVTAFAENGGMDRWASQTSRIEANTIKLLELFATAGCKATFFAVGWIAEKHPQLIRQVAAAGHEIACHSYAHRLVYSFTRSEFRDDTRKAKDALEDAGGVPVSGYRAPSFSITKNTPWAFEILAELGFTYDSSIFPITHMDHGMPQAPRFPFQIKTCAGNIVEFPMPTLDLGPFRSPFGGGAYFRLLPYRYTRWAIRHLNECEKHPICFYVHPWEIDSEQPRMAGTITSRVRQYFGLKKTEVNLRRLLADIEFCTLGELIAENSGSFAPACPTVIP
jgi:polysaccharide deacetylase family protein (PEP-CTERM system associated)